MRSVRPLLAVLLLALPVSAQQTVRTGFDPRRDGLPVANLGDYGDSNRGNCYGMSLLAIDTYLRRLGSSAGREHVGRRPQDGYLREQATAARAQHVTVPSQARLVDALDAVGYPAPINQALARIRRTGEPEVLGFTGQAGGHAVVLHGYEDGALLIYDPNHPNQTIRWPFDPELGLGPHPLEETGPLYREIDQVGSRPPSQLDLRGDLQRVRQECEVGASACTERLLQFSDVSARDDGRRTLIAGNVSSVSPAGEVGPPARRVHVVLDGRPTGLMAPVAESGAFRASVPRELLRPGSRVELVAVTEGARFAGFTEVPRDGSAAQPGPTASRPEPAPASSIRLSPAPDGPAPPPARPAAPARPAPAAPSPRPRPTRPTPGLGGALDAALDQLPQ